MSVGSSVRICSMFSGCELSAKSAIIGSAVTVSERIAESLLNHSGGDFC